MMMKRAVLLVIICLVMSASGSPYYPSIRFGQRDTSILMTSSIGQPIHLRRENNSALRQRAELRSGRHADAIFTNSYRKVLGQVSARKFLQSIMGKQLHYNVKRKSDIYKDTYEQDLSPIQRKRLQRTAKQCQEAKIPMP
ncbi:somatoliberin [Esox lucius]|uniref:somatoliberin n=1 Tax=Esox lucius TaxID=8010 RepID=UPI00057646A4|nr:somatoliberin [Esox lucius]